MEPSTSSVLVHLAHILCLPARRVNGKVVGWCETGFCCHHTGSACDIRTVTQCAMLQISAYVRLYCQGSCQWLPSLLTFTVLSSTLYQPLPSLFGMASRQLYVTDLSWSSVRRNLSIVLYKTASTLVCWWISCLTAEIKFTCPWLHRVNVLTDQLLSWWI